MMSNKTIFGFLVVEVLICFLPITALWALGVYTMIMIAASALTSIFVPLAWLIIIGGTGLTGLFQVMKHIYQFGIKPANSAIQAKLYVGIIILSIIEVYMLFVRSPSIADLLFVLPIICGIHLVYLTRPEKTTNKNSIFDDQVI